jgi:formiminotetrahydrofolate cyclodeaminase
LSSQFGRCAELTAREFNLRVADPELFSGGGSVAALVAANACALALLVGRLSVRRRANVDAQAAIGATLASIEALTEWFYSAADQDLIVLDELLAAQRALKQGGARADFTAALLRAARSPLELAERCAQLVAHVNSLTPSASRFTVSDLGAAAALAAGACRAALLTVDVNIALLRDERGVDQSVVEPLAARADDTFASVAKLGAAVQSAATAAIARTHHA